MSVPEAAYEEYRFLLDRGYNPRSALRLVGERHLLPVHELNVLRRRCFPQGRSEEVRLKTVHLNGLAGKRVAVDLYNVLITTEAIATGEAFPCDDGFWRDARGVYGKYRITTATATAMGAIVRTLASAGIVEVRLMVDAQVSHSGALAQRARAAMAKVGLAGDVKVLKDVDASMRRQGCSGWVVATSDTGIIRYVTTVVDVPGGMSA